METTATVVAITVVAITMSTSRQPDWWRREWALLVLEGVKVGAEVGLALMATGVEAVTAEPVTTCNAVLSEEDTAGVTRAA